MHPLSLFRHCPKCGSSQFEVHDAKSKRCLACGFIYYFNPSAAVAAFITDRDGRLLVARRAHEPAKGLPDLPGGFVDLHETGEEAVRREILEETGLTVKRLHYLFSLPNVYTYSQFEVHTLDLFYRCEIDDWSLLKPSDDVEKLFFLAPEEIIPDTFGLDSIRRAVRIFLHS